MSRRTVLRAAVAASSTALAAPGIARSAGGREVAVFGGGPAGLSAAHELAERGFAVTVYEPAFLGGKARSMPVPGTGIGGRADLPGEHGFRFFPSCYQHAPETMSRIPLPGGGNVRDAHLIPVHALTFAPAGPQQVPMFLPLSLEGVLREGGTLGGLQNLQNALYDATQGLSRTPAPELEFFTRRLAIIATSCPERRIGQWENISWWDFIRAEQMSDDYRDYLAHFLSSGLVAAKARTASARTIGQTALVLATATTGLIPQYSRAPLVATMDQILNRPTNEAWIDPWVAYLRSRGVRFAMDCGAAGFEVGGGRVTGVRLTGAPGRVEADWYVCAMPADRLGPLLDDGVLAAAPSLAGILELVTDWLVGIQFYLARPADTPPSHIAVLGSKWALTGIFQAKAWGEDLTVRYGDGRVREILSVDISDWDAPGLLYGKPAKQCTAEEIARETWAQLRDALNRGGSNWLRDEDLLSWHLDPGVRWPDGRIVNDTPLLVNTAGSLRNRPDAGCELSNLAIAGDHVRTNIDLATMEGAVESGRRAANVILDRADSSAERAAIHPLWELPVLDRFKAVDRDRYRQGLPHLLDT